MWLGRGICGSGSTTAWVAGDRGEEAVLLRFRAEHVGQGPQMWAGGVSTRHVGSRWCSRGDVSTVSDNHGQGRSHMSRQPQGLGHARRVHRPCKRCRSSQVGQECGWLGTRSRCGLPPAWPSLAVHLPAHHSAPCLHLLSRRSSSLPTSPARSPTTRPATTRTCTPRHASSWWVEGAGLSCVVGP